MEISENFREMNSSILTSLKIAFDLCNLQFVDKLTTPITKEKINSYFRDIYLASEQFSGILQKAFRKSSTVRSEYERTYVVVSAKEKNKEGRTGRPSHEKW